MNVYNSSTTFNMPVKRTRKLSRPSTAPAVEESLKPLLASHLPSARETTVGMSYGESNGWSNSNRRVNTNQAYMQTVDEDEGDKRIDGVYISSSALRLGLTEARLLAARLVRMLQ